MSTSVRARGQALFLAGLVAGASATGCAPKGSESIRAGDSVSSTGETAAASDSAAAPSTDTAAPAPARAASTTAKAPPVKPLPKPSIDPGRKPAKHLGDTAAPSPAPAPAGSGQDQWLKYDAASNTVTFELIAGPFTFNGYSNGGGTLTLTPKANVVLNFVNKDGTPHSAEVISGEGPIPNSAGDPAIPRAYTNKALEGLPQEGTDDMRFTVPETGKYRIFCGVPGHGLSGMWIWMVIDPAAKAPSFGATK
jgi:plastocyanin